MLFIYLPFIVYFLTIVLVVIIGEINMNKNIMDEYILMLFIAYPFLSVYKLYFYVKNNRQKNKECI